MYAKTTGEKIVLEDLTMWLPPQPARHKIAGYNLKKEDQYWRRTEYPEWWFEAREKEYAIQEQQEAVGINFLNPKYYIDKKCEAFRQQEYDRRLYGYWFFNNGKATYITGAHYFYANWCKLDVGYPTYYDYTRLNFYFRQFCEEDPFCMGYAMMGKRGYGKSAEEHCAQLENITRMPRNRNAVIQSKNEPDAIKNFKVFTVQVWKNLPDFFSPICKNSSDPADSLEFFKPSVKGKKARLVRHEDGDELANKIYCVPAKDKANDMATIHDLIVDEWGKADKAEGVNLEERHRVNLHCVLRNDEKVGIMRCISTIEEIEEGKGNDPAKKFWEDSDQNIRDENGMTKTMLYRRFLPYFATTKKSVAGDQIFVDKYGFIDEKRAKEYQDKTRKGLLENIRAYMSHVRKNPYNAEEAFGADNEKCEFNIGLLNYSLNKISESVGKRILYGKFEENKTTKKVEFKEARTEKEKLVAKWSFSYFPENSSYANNVVQIGFNHAKGYALYGPLNKEKFVIGTDAVNKGRDETRVQSKASGTIFYKFDPNTDNSIDFNEYCSFSIEDREKYRHHPKYNFKSHNWIGDYLDRPDDEEEYYMDMLLACRFFGCMILPERNTVGIIPWFVKRGFGAFVMKRPKSSLTKTSMKDEDHGVPANTQTIGMYVSKGKTFIERHGHRVRLPRILKDLVKWDSLNTTKFDSAVSALLCMFDVEEPNTFVDQTEEEKPKKPKPFFARFRNGHRLHS